VLRHYCSNKTTVHLGQSLKKSRLALTKLPPILSSPPSIVVVSGCHAVWEDPLAHDLKELNPALRLRKRAVSEVDRESVAILPGARIHFLPAYVPRETKSVPFVIFHESPVFAFFEQKPSAPRVDALESKQSVRLQRLEGLAFGLGAEVGIDYLDASTIQYEAGRPNRRPLAEVC
jgi:hypothetical protein